jgi:lipoic acid synthetase
MKKPREIKEDAKTMKNILQKPAWIRGTVSWDENYKDVQNLIRELKLNTVCGEAACPNKGECWEARHVTFMILGEVCTRGCIFCNVTGGKPSSVNPQEPANVAKAVRELGSKYVVVTSVTRDDLEDKGAGHFVSTVKEIKTLISDVLVELLIPDLDADPDLLRQVAFSTAEVVGHNIEMPEALYGNIRPNASYQRSLKTIRMLNSMKLKGAQILVKSALMLGLGEGEKDISATLRDLKDAGTDIVYMGQYLSPSEEHYPVKRYYSPDEFASLREEAEKMGFKAVLAAPMVRSSYRAQEAYTKASKAD